MRLAVFSVVVYFVVIFSACGGESSEQWVRINDEFLREYFSERLEDFGIQNKLIGEKIYLMVSIVGEYLPLKAFGLLSLITFLFLL